VSLNSTPVARQSDILVRVTTASRLIETFQVYLSHCTCPVILCVLKAVAVSGLLQSLIYRERRTTKD